ncbi:CcdB family protein [Burkholderiaceae bacterium DAT-1]|nr:CcdB family protein [Burkholderiaceae bacterium DAT-1]
MAQFDVYTNDNVATRSHIPYLVDIQSDLLESLATRVVIPLVRQTDVKSVKTLMPIVALDGQHYVLLTPQLAGVQSRILKQRVGSMSEYRGEIVKAMDLLVTGI